MPRRDIRLVISDNDGCLLPEAGTPIEPDLLHPLAEHNRRAFAALAAGRTGPPPITVSTGRPQPFVELLLRLIHNTEIPAICESGAVMYSLRDNVARLNPAISDADLAVIGEMKRWLAREMGWNVQAGKEAMLSVYAPEPEAMACIAGLAAEHVERRGWPLAVERTVEWVNIRLRHVSKTTGIHWLVDEVGIDRDHLLGIGDTGGDLALREACRWFACPSNAVDELKAVADYVSPKPLLEGVLDILAHFLND